jgi:flagellar biosynthetic protein FlhB
MAEDDDRDKTESPTQKRLDEARAKGQVPRSRDLSAAAVILAGGLGLNSMGALMGSRLLAMMHDGLTVSGAEAFDTGQMLTQFEHAAAQGGIAMTPLLGLLMAAGLLAPMAIGGWNFSAQALVPNFTRLNPITGLGRVFSMHGVIELGKALARIIVVVVISVLVLRHQFHSYNALAYESPRVAVGHALALCGSAFIALGGALGIIALIDVPLALWQYSKSMRMSKQEIRDESKETDGNPQAKGQIRRVQQAMARKRMMQQVPKADVVITNPTHYAVALRYDETRMNAPIVIAKGKDLLALRIKEIAAEHGIAVVEAPPLARALHANCELGDVIPARLYAAVAKVLTYVYQLRTARRRGEAAPPPPSLELPEE